MNRKSTESDNTALSSQRDPDLCKYDFQDLIGGYMEELAAARHANKTLEEIHKKAGTVIPSPEARELNRVFELEEGVEIETQIGWQPNVSPMAEENEVAPEKEVESAQESKNPPPLSSAQCYSLITQVLDSIKKLHVDMDTVKSSVAILLERADRQAEFKDTGDTYAPKVSSLTDTKCDTDDKSSSSNDSLNTRVIFLDPDSLNYRELQDECRKHDLPTGGEIPVFRKRLRDQCAKYAE